MVLKNAKFTSALLALCTLGPANIAHAGNNQLAKALEAISAPDGTSPAGSDKKPVIAKRGWNVPNDGSGKDTPCSMSYRDGTNLMGYIGPSKGWNKSYFFVSGPKIPYADRPAEHRVALVTEGQSNQTVKAIRWPLDRKGKQFALLFELTDFDAALAEMNDSENLAVLEMREEQFNFKQSLFSGSWTAGHAAREKVRSCLAAKK